MSNIEHRELLENALREIKRLRQERDRLLERFLEPIAIIGMACRFPGASSPEELWNVSNQSIDCISKVPADRWDATSYFDPIPDTPGKMVTTEGGFLPDVRGFDAAFFGISPREARSMDPQQRLALEVTWEAIERSAIAADSLYGTRVGVFLGLSNLEYANLIRSTAEAKLIDAYFGTGNAASVAAGRIAYHFGFKGPALTVDTACSSSLVAVHLAVASLRRRECNLAVAGGVNLMLSPETSVHFSRARMLSSDGRCKPFSAQANGYGRAEGCGVVLLKRLSDAIADGDPIDGVIYGTAVNHDGRSAGLTAPNGPSQEAVIHAALKDANWQANDIQFVEAHGTGTPLGDPIEAGAVARVYGAERTESNPLLITTIKANIGHAEGAAGIAGLIHACMCLRNRRVPPLLHMVQRSLHIDQNSLAFARTGVDLLRTEKPLRAGVSSFGFSGTNAHVVLQESKRSHQAHDASKRLAQLGTSSLQYFVLSAKTEEAVQQLSKCYRDWFASNSEVSWQDVCYSLQVGRNHFQYRLAFLTSSITDAIRCLESYLTEATLTEENSCQCTKDFMAGATIDWLAESAEVIARSVKNNLMPNEPAKRIALPTYRFQHESYWVRGVKENPVHTSIHATKNPWMNGSHTFSPDEWRRLGDHRLFGAAVMPAVAWLDILSRAAKQGDERTFQLKNIRFTQMMVISATNSPSFETQFFCESPALNEFGIFAPKTSAPKLELDNAYVKGEIEAVGKSEWLGGDLQSIQSRLGNEIDVRQIYERFGASGLEYGPHFRKLISVSTDGNSALGLLDVADEEIETNSDASSCHGLLDSALHVVAGAALKYGYDANDATTFFPVAIHSLQWFDRTKLPELSMAVIRPASDAFAIEADLFIWNTSGQPLLQLLGIRFEGFATTNPINASMKSTIPVATPEVSRVAERLTTAQLLTLPVHEQLRTLQEYLRVQLAHELEMPAEKLLPDQPLSDFGLDSLMVFRLGIQLEAEFGFAVNSRAMMQGQSLRALAESLLWRSNNFTATQE